ncbi:MAG: pilin [Patescibacteria group bacterium]|jgi:hypothetical protein
MRIKAFLLFTAALGLFLAPKAHVFAAVDCAAQYDTCIAPAELIQQTCIDAQCTGNACPDCVANFDRDTQGCFDQRRACFAANESTLPSTTSNALTSGSATGASVSLINPLGTANPQVIIGNLIKAILSIIGSVTLLMFIYGGVLWITSMGNDKMVAKGKAVLVWTVVGLAVIAGAYTLTQAVITGLTTGSVLGT